MSKYKGDLKDFIEMCEECNYRIEVYEIKDMFGDIVRYQVCGDTFDLDENGERVQGDIKINFDKDGNCLDFDEGDLTYIM